MRPPHKPVAAAASAALAILLTACSVSVGSGGGYDPDDVAERVQEAQEEATPDLEVTDPSCPDDGEPAEGDAIECTVTIAGVEAPYTVTFTSVDDDGARFDIAPAQAIVSTEKAVAAIAAELDKQGVAGVEVDCGEAAVLVQEPATTFTCALTRGVRSSELTVTINDVDGNISF
ncbi:MAG: DUF4333 domain-containing protein [Nocardioides sp.]